MKKTKLLLASLFFLLLGIAFSCKVDIESLGEPIDSESNSSLKRARISFEERLKDDPTLKKYKIEPIWSSAAIYKNTVEVAFEMEGKIYLPSIVKNQKNSGRARLIFTEKGSKFSFMIVHYMASANFKGKIKNINSQNLKANNFDGVVSTNELGSTETINFHFVDGKIIKKAYVNKDSKSKKNKRVQACTETCEIFEIETEWYQQNPGQSEPQYVYSTYRIVSECVMSCDNDPDPDPPFCEQFPDLCDNTSGGGDNTMHVEGRLCGSYTFTPTGNGRTAEIHGLGTQAYNSSNNNHVSASWAAMCITFGNSIQTSNNASIAFNLAWNNTLQLVDVWLVQHQNATSLEFKQITETILRTQLGPAAGGYYALTIGGCNNIPASNAQFCP